MEVKIRDLLKDADIAAAEESYQAALRKFPMSMRLRLDYAHLIIGSPMAGASSVPLTRAGKVIPMFLLIEALSHLHPLFLPLCLLLSSSPGSCTLFSVPV